MATADRTDAELYEQQRLVEEEASPAQTPGPGVEAETKPEFKSVGNGIHVQVNGPLALIKSLERAVRSPEQISKHHNGPKHDWEVVRLLGTEPIEWGSKVVQARINDEQRLTRPVPFTHAKREARKKIAAANGGLGS